VVTLVAEGVVFIIVGNLIGFGFAVLILLALMALGAYCCGGEGLRAWRRFQSWRRRENVPGTQLGTARWSGLLGRLSPDARFHHRVSVCACCAAHLRCVAAGTHPRPPWPVGQLRVGGDEWCAARAW